MDKTLGHRCLPTRVAACTLSAIMLVSCTSCGGRRRNTPSNSSASTQTTVVPQPNSAQLFQTIKLKVKSDVIYQVDGVEQKVILEMYVDEEGDGEGLIGFGDIVLNLLASNNKLYVLLDDNTVIYISDVNARGYFADITASTIDDMAGVGFGFTEGFPTSFNGRAGNMTIRTQYAQSTNSYKTTRVSDDNAMTLQNAVSFIRATYYASEDDTGTGTSDDKDIPNTFYVEDEYGITIDGKLYSLGDTCNPTDYFAGLTPEGFLYSDSYKEDTRITFTHVSYISSTGRTTFTTASDYVQAIQTTANFNFRGFYRGMSTAELKYALAYRLSKREAEEYEPLDENIIVDSFKGKTYYCHTDTMNIEFRMDSDGLKEIYITRPLSFM